jgi:HK97 family phage major capsid protein
MQRLAMLGGALKAQDDGGTVGGYLVRFSDGEERDLTGEYFTSKTYLGPRDGDGADCLFHHGFPVREGLEHLAEEWFSPIKTQRDDVGIWAETVLDLSDEYQKKIHEMVQAGRLAWSSGSAGHMVRKASDGKIERWPIIEGSLTFAAAQPFGTGVQAKSVTLEEDKPMEEKNETTAPPPVRTVQAGIRESEPPPAKAEPDYESRFAEMEQRFNERLDSVMAKFMQVVDSEPVQRLGYVTPDGGGGDPQVKSLGDFAAAVWRGDTRRLSEVYSVKLNEGSGASGGYTVPVEYGNMIMRIATEESVVRPRADVRTMSGRSLRVPTMDYSGDFSAGQSAILAGMTMAYENEEGDIDSTDVKFRQIEMVAHKLARTIPISNELLRDSALALEQTVTQMFGEAVAFTEDYYFLNGDGAGKPLGVLEADACITTATALTTSPDVDKILTMHKRLMPQSEGRAVWVIHPLLWDAIAGLSDSNVLSYLPDLQGRMVYRLLGMPVIRSEKMPQGFDVGGLLLADFSQYFVADAGGIEIAVSQHIYFESDQTGLRVTKRHDGQPKLNAPIKIGTGSNASMSPFVKSK